MISDFAILGMVFTLLICFVLPILAMGVLKIRQKAQILLFLAGISMYLVFVMILERLFISLTIQVVPAFGENAALYTVLAVLAAAIFESLEFALIARLLQEHMDRGSRAVMFGLGHGGANAALSSGLTSITYYSIAIIANTEGADYLTEKLSGEELTVMQNMIEQVQADIPVFYISGVQQLLMMMVYCCAAVIMWMAMTGRLPRKWAAASAGMIALIHLPIELGSTGIFPSYWISPIVCLLIGIVTVVFTRKLYIKIEGKRPRQERMPVRRLR